MQWQERQKPTAAPWSCLLNFPCTEKYWELSEGLRWHYLYEWGMFSLRKDPDLILLCIYNKFSKVRPCDRKWSMFGMWHMHWHLWPVCVALLRMIQTHPHTYLVIWWHITWPPVLLAHCCISNSIVKPTGGFVWSFWVWGLGCLTRPHLIFGTTGTFQCFLLRDESLTWHGMYMYMVSLIVLLRLCDSLPTTEKLSTQVWWPVMLALT